MSIPKKKDTITPTPTSDILSSIYPLIHERCNETNLKFLECKGKHGDPIECTSTGKDVIDCVDSTYILI